MALFLLDNIGMLDAFKEGNLADCSWWYTIILLLKSDLFEGYKVSSDQVFTFVDHTVSTFSKLL